jgi:hypothetical protein
VEKDTLWIRAAMSDGMPRIILERGNFVVSVTSQLEIARKTEFLMTMESRIAMIAPLGRDFWNATLEIAV